VLSSVQHRPQRRVFPVAVLALIAVLSATAPVAAAGAADDGPEAPASKRKKGKTKHERYPPSALWYRIELKFSGEMNYRPSADVERQSAWQLRSNTAVRVSLRCVNRKRHTDPGFWGEVKVKRRNGKTKVKRVGGCAGRRGHNGNLRPTLRFKANASGEVTSWRNVEHRHEEGCEPRDFVQTLVDPQPLRGVLATESSATFGFRFASIVAGPSGTDVDVFNESTTCDSGKGPSSVPGSEGTRFFTPTDHIGFESVIDSRRVPEMMRFAINARRFGRTLEFRFGPLSQVYDPFRPADPGAGESPWDKVYSYQLKLTPCPRHGRNVADC